MFLVESRKLKIIAASIVAANIWAAPALATQSDKQEQPGNAKGPFIVNVIEAEPEEITDKSHPDYVKCRTESVIGSRARKRRVCMTNAQWKQAERQGNRFAAETISPIQGMSGGGSDANNGN